MNILADMLNQRTERPNLVIADSNFDLLKRMYVPLKFLGYNIKTFNPNGNYTLHFNPLANLSRYIKHSQNHYHYSVLGSISDIIIPTLKGSYKAYFYDEAREALNLFIMLLETKTYQEYYHISLHQPNFKPSSTSSSNWNEITITNVLKLMQTLLGGNNHSSLHGIMMYYHHIEEHYRKLIHEHKHLSFHENYYYNLLTTLDTLYLISGLMPDDKSSDSGTVFSLLMEHLEPFEHPSVQKLTNANEFNFSALNLTKAIVINFNPHYRGQKFALRLYSPSNHKHTVEFFKGVVPDSSRQVVPITIDVDKIGYSYCPTDLTIHDKKAKKGHGMSITAHLNVPMTTWTKLTFSDPHDCIVNAHMKNNDRPTAIFLNDVAMTEPTSDLNVLNNLLISELYCDNYVINSWHAQRKTGFILSNLHYYQAIPNFLNCIYQSECNHHHDAQFIFMLIGNLKHNETLYNIIKKADLVIGHHSQWHMVITDKKLFDTIRLYASNDSKKYPLHILFPKAERLSLNKPVPCTNIKALAELSALTAKNKRKHPKSFKLANHHMIVKVNPKKINITLNKINTISLDSPTGTVCQLGTVIATSPNGLSNGMQIIFNSDLGINAGNHKYLIPSRAVIATC